ncbi:MAG: hypothetical protein ABI791_13530 [Acidobacteriota bacterium]
MKRFSVFLALTFVVSTFAGCSGSANTNTADNTAVVSADNANKANTNVEELGVLINVPYESEEAFWKQDAAHKKVIAVLRFPEGEANRLVDDAGKIAPPQEANITAESWFPPELIAQSGISGEDNLTGKAYAANSFFQDPYNSGRITRIENTDYFVLELTAK